MNDRTEVLVKTFKPRLAIIAHSTITSNHNEWYLESHVLNDNGQILEGKPLQQETIQGIVDIFFDERQNSVQFGGIIPHNLIKFDVLPGGQYSMMWYRPEEQRQLYFASSLSLPSGQAWVPALIYKVNRRYLSVYALNSNERPDEKSGLFRAPFHNVHNDGSVCLGSAHVKKPVEKTYAAAMKYWEDLFWLSEFSHLNGASNPAKTNINSLWKRLVKDPKVKWSGIDQLVPLKNDKKLLTLESLL
jgi:PRTRC genetic system protein B